MSATLLKRIAGVLAAVIAIWFLASTWRRSERDEPGAFQLPALDSAQVERVSLRRPADSIVAVREAGAWSVNGFPASAEYVSRFLRAYADTGRRTELVATSAASHGRLGVDSIAGRRMTVTVAGRPVVDLVLGNRGPDFEGVYLRSAADSAVYLLRGAFPDLLLDGLEAWRDRTILALAPDSIGAAKVEAGRAHWELARKGAAWLLDGGATDSVKVRRFLSEFAGLHATGFPDPDKPVSGFEHAARVVTLTSGAGTPLARLAFLEGETGSYWVRLEGKAVVYKLPTATVDLLAPAKPDLAP